MQAHWLIPFVPCAVGVNVTETAVPSTVPLAKTTPVVALTVRVETYLVGEKLVAQVLKLLKPDDCTISVTQVRALDAARTTSETLAFAV